jgi:uncharacterized protein YjbI with pentapeptide repeats
MRVRKRDLLKVGITIAGMLFLLALVAWVPVVDAHVVSSGLAAPATATVQATPTVDATVTALNKEQLTQQVAQQQHTWNNWLWSNAAVILSTLVIVVGALIGLGRWRWDRRDAQDRELKDRQNEREKRAEERFQAAGEGLGDEKEGARISATILLRTFLRPGYEQFYTQTFDLAVANLRMLKTAAPIQEDPPTPLPPLNQALIVAFKEAFPLARSQNIGSPQSLDATAIQLDYAYLGASDLEQVWMPRASLRKADLVGAKLTMAILSEADLSGAHLFRAKLNKASLSGANLREAKLLAALLREATLRGADLRGADLRGADLGEADLGGANLNKADLGRVNLEDARSLKETDLRGAIGLTKEQLAACKAKGAIIDEEPASPAPNDETQILAPRPVKWKHRSSDQENDT